MTAPKPSPAIPQAAASGTRPRSRPKTRARPAPNRPDAAPGDHLPRRPRALAEEQVAGQRGDGADHEPGRAAERVAGDQHDVGRRLDVGQRGEGDPAERGHRRQRRDERDHARASGGCARTRRSRPRSRRRGGASSRRSSSCRHPLGAPRAPCSGVSAPPAPPSTRATWVAKYQPPASTSCGAASATGRPSPSRITRVANAAANSASWVATIVTPVRSVQARGERVAAGRVHPARRLVEQQQLGVARRG